MSGDENKQEAHDRELIELLNELRIALPGVQILLAFLLTVPFTQRFATISAFQENVYFGVLLCTAVSSVLLIAPSAQHRLLFRQRERSRLLKDANKLAITGIAFLAVAIAGVVLLIADLLFGELTAVLATSVIAFLLVVLWYILPLIHRFTSD